MGITLAFANQKGGVGKTTSAINIAAALGGMGYKILLADMDPQANCTSGVGISRRQTGQNIYNVLIDSKNARDVILKTEYKNLDLLPSNINLAGADISLSDLTKREETLARALGGVKERYNFIIIDCPPSLSLLTINSLVAADYVIVPMQCEYFALEGLSQLSYTIKQVQTLYNTRLELGGVILTMYDGRLNLSIQVMEEIKKYFPGKVFKNAVPRNVRISEAPSHGKPILYYDKYSRGGLAYNEIARELEEKLILTEKTKTGMRT